MWRHTESATKRNYDGAAKKRKKHAGRNRRTESEVKKTKQKPIVQKYAATPLFDGGFLPPPTILI